MTFVDWKMISQWNGEIEEEPLLSSVSELYCIIDERKVTWKRIFFLSNSNTNDLVGIIWIHIGILILHKYFEL